MNQSEVEEAKDPDNSGQLFNSVKDKLGFKNDYQLAGWLNVSPSFLSKIRHGIYEVNSDIILTIHEKVGWPVDMIRKMIRL